MKNVKAKIVHGCPALSNRALGWLRYMHRKVNIGDDWSKDGKPSEAWDDKTAPPTLNWHRFDLTFGSLAIAMMSEVTPAWREVYEKILNSLAYRMTTYWAWHDWIEQRGEDPGRGSYPPTYYQLLIPPGYAGKYNVPGYAGNGLLPHQFEPDPIATSGNIYYKGFFNFVLGLYEYVSGSDRYDSEFDLVYDDKIRFVYNHTAISETIAKQWSQNIEGIHCEVRKIWPMCTYLTGLGVKMHDTMHGTDWYWTFRNWYEYAKQNYISPVRGFPPEWVTLYYDPDIKFNFKILPARPWLLTSWFLIPHDRRMAHLTYEGAKNRFLVMNSDGSAHFSSISGSLEHDPYSTSIGISLAKEFGDVALYVRLRRWVEKKYQPTFDSTRGEFYYLFGFDEPFPPGQFNDWIIPSIVGEPQTWWKIFNRPNLEKFIQPTVYNIDYSRMGVSQAFYDGMKRALIISTYPTDPSAVGEETIFKVKNLEGSTGYSVYLDGKLHRNWKISEGEMEITATVESQSFIVRKQ